MKEKKREYEIELEKKTLLSNNIFLNILFATTTKRLTTFWQWKFLFDMLDMTFLLNIYF